MIGKAIDFFIGKGYFEIEIKNNKDIMVLNLLKDNGFFNCRQVGSKIKLSCTGKGARAISKILDKQGLEYGFKGMGIVYLFKRLVKRGGIAFGLAAAMLLHVALSGLIFDVEIAAEGEIDIPEKEIALLLREQGVYEGCRRKSINIPKIGMELMVAEKRAEFVHLNINGARAVLKIKQKTALPQKEYDKKNPCNLVAKCDGIILRADVYGGRSEVESGDSVTKGQLLVSSFFESRTGIQILKRARGVVFASTAPRLRVFVPKESVVFVNQENASVKQLKLFDSYFTFSKQKLNDTKAVVDRSVEKKSLYAFGVIRLPISVVCTNITLAEKMTVSVDKEQARKTFDDFFEKWCLSQAADFKLVEKSVEMTTEESYYVFEASLDCIENICTEIPFEIG